MAQVLEEAEQLASTGPVLATFDAPLGVPESYLAAVGRPLSPQAPTTFLELLADAHRLPRFFEGTSVAGDWSVERPFFSVPAGEGGLRSYHEAAAQHDVSLYRSIDRVTGAKSAFIKSGIPGSVGSAACALWQELAPRLTANRAFKVWPFDGELQTLLQSSQVVVGEIYPRAAYATALLDVQHGLPAPLNVAKTKAADRHQAIAVLQASSWSGLLGVTFENLAEAEEGEDDFDACLTVAALLRCVLEGLPLCPSHLQSAQAEGGMLGTGSVDLESKSKMFGTLARVRYSFPAPRVPPVPSGPCRPDVAGALDAAGLIRCPIAGCNKTYRGSRGGWDAHIGSVRLHPHWHPDLTSAEDRKRRFETEFPEFFAR